MTAERLVETMRLANELMAKHGLIEAGWTFGFSTSKRRVAVCKHGPKKIEFSMNYLVRTPMAEVKDILLHEIAHALVGHSNGHNYVWKRKCIEIDAKPQRLASEEVKTVASFNYVIKCPTCDRQWKRYRLKKSMHGARCPSCKTVVKIYKYRKAEV